MLIPAAQYLRMSTEHQQYSLENQAAKIAEYALGNGFEVIKTYRDSGRSGLLLTNRPALATLLSDVVSKRRTYQAILVYDVSRWGRFQDTDEAAHYEFLCKKAGVRIHYCAEQFFNDGSVPTAILKTLKRTMAAEYSRELGVKVYTGQERLAKKGFSMGGVPGYGLRRLMLSSDGQQKGYRGRGDHKSFTKDRVVIVPGAPNEVEVVQQIFAWALAGVPAVRIAQLLNQRQIPAWSGSNWNHYSILYILRNPTYAGCYVWGRTAQRLGGNAKRMAVNDWIVVPNAFPALVSRDQFDEVQKNIGVQQVYSDEEMLAGLRLVLQKYGKITRPLINGTKGIPCESAYYDRFGNLENAYRKIGYLPRIYDQSYFEQRARTRLLREYITGRVCALSNGRIDTIQDTKTTRPQLLVDGHIRVDIVVCPRSLSRTNFRSWFYYPHARKREAAFTLACILNRSNRTVCGICLIPGTTRRGRLTQAKFQEMGIRITRPLGCAELCYHEKRFHHLQGTA